jgi:hypothetical protein
LEVGSRDRISLAPVAAARISVDPPESAAYIEVDVGRTSPTARSSVENRNTTFFNWMYAVLLLFALAVFGLGLYEAVTSGRQQLGLLAAGCMGVLAVLLIWALTLNLQAISQETARRQAELFTPVHERLEQLAVLLNLISEQQLISDRAKTIAFRDNERDAVRRAIREEMAKKDWDAATTLVNSIEASYGYHQEADSLRAEIAAKRDEETRKTVSDALAIVDRFCRDQQWPQASQEAEKLAVRFPDNPQIKSLPQEIETRRQALKQKLLDAWNDAVKRKDVDGGIETLRDLDLYLTPAEAAAMQETARQIFHDKLQILGQQFTLAIKDRKWAGAIEVGETIMRDFPNARMADEVRAKMRLLREQAGQPQPPVAAR